MKKMWCALWTLQHGFLEKLISMRLQCSRTLIETNRWLECLPTMQIYLLICSGKGIISSHCCQGKEWEEHYQERYKKLFFESIYSFKLNKKRQ